jgi:hypothetical protein
MDFAHPEIEIDGVIGDQAGKGLGNPDEFNDDATRRWPVHAA